MASDDVIRVEIDDGFGAIEAEIAENELRALAGAHSLSAIASKSAIRIVFAAEESGVLAESEGGKRIGGSDGEVMLRVSDQDRSADLAAGHDIAESALRGERELGEGRLEQGHGLNGAANGLGGGGDEPGSEGVAGKVDAGLGVVAVEGFKPGG